MTQSAITLLARTLGDWADRPANERFMRRDQELLLTDALGEPRRRPQVHVAAWMLGTWHLGHGFALVMGGVGRGFDEARRGQALRRCSLLLRQRYQERSQRGAGSALAFSLLQGTITALLGLALHDPGAEELYDLLRRLPDSEFRADSHLALFTRELLTLRAGERPTVTPRLGPYAEVLMHWQGDPRLFAQKVEAVLDLHLDSTQGAAATFADPPSQVYPLEALAIQHVRAWLGLPRVRIEHPLMFTNLGQMEPDPAWPNCDLVQRLEQQLRRR